MDAVATASPELIAVRAAHKDLERLVVQLRLSASDDREAVYRSEIEPLLRAHIERLRSYLGSDLAFAALGVPISEPGSDAGLLELQERLRRVGEALDAHETQTPWRRPLWRTILALLSGGVAGFWWLGFVSAVFLLSVAPERAPESSSSSTLSFMLFAGLGFALFAVALWRPLPRRLPSSRLIGALGVVSLVAAFVMAAVLPGATTSVAREGELVDVAGLATVIAPTGWQVKREPTGIAPNVEFAKDLSGDRSRPENNETLRADLIVMPAPGLRLSRDAFFADVVAGAKRDTEGGRLTSISLASRRDTARGADCVRIDNVQEDRGVPQFLGTVFLLKAHDLVCFHPAGPALVRARWSHRHLASATPSVPETAAEPYLDSLRFSGTPRTSTPSAAPGLGSVLYRDTFTSQSGRWTRFDNEHFFIDYQGGTYQITQRKPGSWGVLAANGAPRARDVHTEVDIQFTPGDGSLQLVGPICRLLPKENTSYYAFVISPNGFYGIARAANTSELTWLAASSFWLRPAVGTPDVHRIEADCIGTGTGTILNLRVDAIDLLQVQDDSGRSVDESGLAGLYVQGGKGFAATVTRYAVWNALP